MKQGPLFSILDSVDSTNNYAMAQVHAGLSKHGNAVFARHQKSGKGQRGKAWMSNADENIILSVIIQPKLGSDFRHFRFNALIAIQCIRFLQSLTGHEFRIKWPNDIYWRDRKAGGILIENIVNGNEWKWAVVGIGINVNQSRFNALVSPVSLGLVTGREYDAIALARELHQNILFALQTDTTEQEVLKQYNDCLYKKNEEVQLRKNNVVFTTTIQHVDQFGQLHTRDAMDRIFTFGEVEWVWV